MNRLTFFIALFIMTTTLAGEVKSQEQYKTQNTLIQKLESDGFENIGVKQINNDVYIFYENRVYRWEIDGIKKILNEASDSFNDSTNLHIVPFHRQVPITMVTTRISEYRKFLHHEPNSNYSGNLFKVSFDTDSISGFLKQVKLQNKSFRKIDLILLPGFKVQFGNYDNPIEWQINISPIIRTSLWKGMLFSAQMLIPLHSELQQPDENKTRLGTVAIDQLFRLPKNVFLNVSSGIFSYPNRISSVINYERYGLHTDLRKYFFNSSLCAGTYMGYTGQMRFSKGILDYWPLDKFTFGIYGEYREPKYDLTTRISVGKFLYNDYAVRMDISRQFKEVSIGFYALKSEIGTNGGFNIIIPISPRKHFKPGLFRIDLERTLQWEYAATTVYPSATRYKTNSDMDETMHNYSSGYLKKQLSIQP